MSKILTKAVIVESVHDQLDVPKKECVEMVEKLVEIIKSTLASGEDVLIIGSANSMLRTKRSEEEGTRLRIRT